MPADNVNCEALRLICQEAREMIALKKCHEILRGETLSEIETALWMLDRHVEEHDAKHSA